MPKWRNDFFCRHALPDLIMCSQMTQICSKSNSDKKFKTSWNTLAIQYFGSHLFLCCITYKDVIRGTRSNYIYPSEYMCKAQHQCIHHLFRKSCSGRCRLCGSILFSGIDFESLKHVVSSLVESAQHFANVLICNWVVRSHCPKPERLPLSLASIKVVER